MTSFGAALRGVSLRYKILIPFVLLSLVTWLIAADILGRSSANAIRTHARTQAQEVALSAAHHPNLRVGYAKSEISSLSAEAEILASGQGLGTTMHNLAPNVASLFLTRRDIAGQAEKDLVKVMAEGRKDPLADLRRSLLEPKPLDDATILAATQESGSAAQIVKVKSIQKAYVVGAAKVRLPDSSVVIFLVGDAIDRRMLETNAIPNGCGLFLVDPHGELTGVGAPAESTSWTDVFRTRTEGEVTVDDVDYILTSAPIQADGPADLSVVAAIPTKPIIAAASRDSRQAWLVVGLGGLCLVAMAVWLTTLLTRPLRSLTVAARSLADGDLDTRAEVRTEDEIGALGSAFNLMGEKLKQRDANLRVALNELTRLSETDALTGLHNHRALHRELEREVSRASRQGTALSIVVSTSTTSR